MGYFTVMSAVLHGLRTELVYVEADVGEGLPIFHMVGYLSSEVKEAAERVRSAIKEVGHSLPSKRIVVNLSPANVRKRGTSFDLPIAIAVLGALQAIPSRKIKETVFVGELGLDGRLLPVEGILSIVSMAREKGMKYCVLPKENAKEGRLIQGIEIIGAVSLSQVCEWIKEKEWKSCEKKEELDMYVMEHSDIDYSEIQGQEGMKRATLIAVAGNHNLLYVGPPGSGKTMMAKRIPTILPTMTMEESLEITRIYSTAGLLDSERPLMQRRPFREVHHTISRAALLGGGVPPRPGEITLSSGGVLFLDELAEFKRSVLESLRQPMEEKCIRLIRNQGIYVFPADFMMVAATNPCPCGYYPDRNLCNCTPGQIRGYIGKISHPFLDRLDICIEAPKVEYDALSGREDGHSSAQMRGQVEAARMIQRERFQGRTITTNSQMTVEEIRKYCSLNSMGERMMKQAYEVFHLTARSYYKILRVARTIADVEGALVITEEHLGEAIGYRMLDQKGWGNE